MVCSVCTISGLECLYYKWVGVSVLKVGGSICTISGRGCLYYKWEVVSVLLLAEVSVL